MFLRVESILPVNKKCLRVIGEKTETGYIPSRPIYYYPRIAVINVVTEGVVYLYIVGGVPYLHIRLAYQFESVPRG